jgi:hypothetical protein
MPFAATRAMATKDCFCVLCRESAHGRHGASGSSDLTPAWRPTAVGPPSGAPGSGRPKADPQRTEIAGQKPDVQRLSRELCASDAAGLLCGLNARVHLPLTCEHRRCISRLSRVVMRAALFGLACELRVRRAGPRDTWPSRSPTRSSSFAFGPRWDTRRPIPMYRSATATDSFASPAPRLAYGSRCFL